MSLDYEGWISPLIVNLNLRWKNLLVLPKGSEGLGIVRIIPNDEPLPI